MAVLEWDKVGERRYETGVDHGVLYLDDGRAVVWNGLTGIEDGSSREAQSFFLDGMKYLERHTVGVYSGRLRALTYPDEFEEILGNEPVANGLIYYNQSPKSFNLTYRTRIGNDLSADHGYKIHVLYNLMAIPENVGFETIGESTNPVEFSFALSGTPPMIAGHYPTVHISIDSTKTNPDILATIEDILYGSAISNPRLPPIDELTSLLEMFGSLVIVDNGDGTWTAIDLADQYITMDSSTQFTINNVDVTYLDVSTYEVSTTNPN